MAFLVGLAILAAAVAVLVWSLRRERRQKERAMDEFVQDQRDERERP